MTYTHLNPGNIIRYNGQVWLVAQRTKKTLDLIAFNNSKTTLHLKSRLANGAPVYLAQNATNYIISLLSDIY